MSVLNSIQYQQGHGHAAGQSPASFLGQGGLDRQREGGKKVKKKQHHSPAWPMEETIEEEPEEYLEDAEDTGHMQSPFRANWFSDVGTHLDTPSYSMPSKAFALAAEGRIPFGSRTREENARIEEQFVDSYGAALEPALEALYSPKRLARNRIHWMFDPYKDERVSSLLEWIQEMAYGLATLGVCAPVRSIFMV
jgi:hypothetical protein